MHIESIIKKSLNIKGFKLGKAHLLFHKVHTCPILSRKNSRPHCPVCGRCGPVYDTQPVRTWRHIAGWGIPVLLEYAPRRVKCHHCRRVRVEAMPWSHGKCQLTRSLLKQIALWARQLAWRQVATLFEVSWGQVHEAVATAVEYGLQHRDTTNVTLLGIDELTYRKGHIYLTQVYEIAEGSRRLLWSGVGRSEATLQAFFEYWGVERNQRIQGVCIDLWKPYMNVIHQYAPQAVVVLDKFHLVRQLNEAVDTVRRRESHAALRKVLKGTRYLWLKAAQHLTATRLLKLNQLEAQGLKTHRAWHIKEAFKAIWKCQDANEARRLFQDWFWWSAHSHITPIQKVAKTFQRYVENILNYFTIDINNSIVEGLNNKAKVVMHRSYGFKTTETCKLALMHCLGNLELPP